MSSTNHITSADGTRIAFERAGSGPAVVLVDGAFGSRAFGVLPKLAEHLADAFAVYRYDRRGRGESGDTAPHAVAREVEDLAAVIGATGGDVRVFGISSGAALVLEAARCLPAIQAAVVYEAPFIVDDTRRALGEDFLPRVRQAVAEDRRSDVVRLFMREGIGVPAYAVALMRVMPAWRRLTSVAHTVAYDLAVVDRYQRGTPLESANWADITVPTLSVAGTKSPVWIQNSMRQLADALPVASYCGLPKQTHIVKANVLAPVIHEFFTSTERDRRVGSREEVTV